MTEYRIAITTCGSDEESRNMARDVVANKLAACVQMMPINSVYEWEGNVNEDAEMLLLMKTSASAVDKLQEFVLANHSYDTPEFIVVPIDSGFAGYLKWVDDQTI